MAVGDADVPSVPYDDLFSLAYRFKCPGEHMSTTLADAVVARAKCERPRLSKLRPKLYYPTCHINRSVSASTLLSGKTCGIRKQTNPLWLEGTRNPKGCRITQQPAEMLLANHLRCAVKIAPAAKFIKSTKIRCKIKRVDLFAPVAGQRTHCVGGTYTHSDFVRFKPIAAHCRTQPPVQLASAQYPCRSLTGAWSYNLGFGSTKPSLRCMVSEVESAKIADRLCNQKVHTTDLPSDQNYGGAIATNIIALNCRVYPGLVLTDAGKICTTVRTITPLGTSHGNTFVYGKRTRLSCPVFPIDLDVTFNRARCGTKILGTAPLLVFGRVFGGQQYKAFPLETGRVFGDTGKRYNYYIGTRPPPAPTPPPASTTGPTSPPTG